MNTLSSGDLAWASVLMLLLALLMRAGRFGVAGSLLVSALRMAVQLVLVGFVLKALFGAQFWGWTALAAVVMSLVAAREVVVRQHHRLRGPWGFGTGALSIFLSSVSVTIFGLAVAVRPTPWYSPQYAIPMLGMVLGNTLTAVSLATDRFTSSLRQQRAVVEQRLALGEPAAVACGQLTRDAVRASMIPTINAMTTAGVVSLPGMMTGQILAGAAPTEAVKYQILIWLLIAAGTGFGVLGSILVHRKRLFDRRDRLRLDRLASVGK